MQKVVIITFLLLTVIGCQTVPVVTETEEIVSRELAIKQIEKQLKQRWMALAPYIKEHFDTGNKTTKEIAADLALAEYYQQKKEDVMLREIVEVIG